MPEKDHLRDLENELSGAGGSLDKLLAKKAPEQPEQGLLISEIADKGLEYFKTRMADKARVFVEDLLKSGELDPQMTASELPAFLADYAKKIREKMEKEDKQE